jgi:ELWxxDGT repeat protein
MNLAPDVGSSDPVPFGVLPVRPYHPELVFSADGDGVGRELFTTGASSSTSCILDIYPGPYGSNPVFMGKLGERIVFSANDGPHGREPWITDGWDAWLLKDARLDGSSVPYSTGLVVSGRLIFFADDGVHGFEPWATDGTPDGTRMLADIMPGSLPRAPGGPRALRVFVGGHDSIIAGAGESELRGFLYAPDAEVSFAGTTQITGAVVAKEISFAGGLRVKGIAPPRRPDASCRVPAKPEVTVN